MVGLLDGFLADMPAELAARTRYEHGRRVRQLAVALTPTPVLTAATAQVVAWLDSLNLSTHSRRDYLGSVRDFYDWAWRKGLIDSNPVTPLKPVRSGWQPPRLDALPAPDPSCGLATVIDAYLWDRYGRGEINLRSTRVLADRLRLLINSFGAARPIGQLSRAAVLDWQRSVGAHAPASRRAYLSTVRTFCGWAVDNGYLVADPTARMRPVREPRRVPRALAPDQVGRLLAFCAGNRRDTAIVWLMVGCGLRAMEVTGLTFGDWAPYDRTLRVRGKGGHERLLPVPGSVADALDAYLDEAGRYDGPLIRPTARTAWDRDTPLKASALTVHLSELMTRAGVKRAPGDGISGHALRHTCASDVMERCKNIRTVQAVLGHASLSSTEIYLRQANLAQMRDALEGRAYGVTP
jgi:site-specific recombinase XerD